MTAEKLKSPMYAFWVLSIVTLGYTIAHLGSVLPGITSRETARDVHYGDVACVLNLTLGLSNELVPQKCETAMDMTTCLELQLNGSDYCEWDYNGRGLDYQMIMGPGFNVPLSFVGVLMGFLGDRYNRVHLLIGCSFLFSVSFMIFGAATEYWEILLSRILLAAGTAGCNPFSTGILSDLFPQRMLGLVMAVFNWAIYGAFGIAFPLGHYLTDWNVLGLGWRFCYYLSGIIALTLTILTALTIRDPERTIIGEEKELKEAGMTGKDDKDKEGDSLVKVLLQPRILVMCIAAGFRNAGGSVLAYNGDLYYRQYFPGVDLAWFLFFIFCFLGSLGVAFGGVLSDKLVDKYGIKSRVAILAVSQFLASPFALGSVYFNPEWAMVCLGFSFFFAEMWFGSLFAVIVEMVPLIYRSFTISFFLFVMNMFTAIATVVVEPVAQAIGFRESLYILYVGFYFMSSVFFFLTMFFMKTHPSKTLPVLLAYDNKALSVDKVSDLPEKKPKV